MASIRSYKDLLVWQKSMELVEAVYTATRSLPPEERYGLTAQLRRAAVSVPSNIAEGYARRSRNDYVRFLDVASGSANEVETQVELSERLGFLRAAAARGLLGLTNEVQRMLNGLAGSVSRSDRNRVRPRSSDGKGKC